MRKLVFIFLSLLCLGCSDAILPDGQPQIVVEGWIEAGGPPVVMISTTVPVTSRWQELEPVLESCVVRWATVSVFDGEAKEGPGKPEEGTACGCHQASDRGVCTRLFSRLHLLSQGES